MKITEKPAIGNKEQEEVIESFSQHWIALFIPYVSAFIVLAFSIINFLAANFFVAILFLMFAIYIFARSTLLWVSNIYTVTNLKVFNSRVTFFHKVRKTEIMFSLIKSIIEVKPSFVAHILNYGHVKIGTSSSEPALNLRYIKNSHKLLKKINSNIRIR
jgi:hypothetical protein